MRLRLKSIQTNQVKEEHAENVSAQSQKYFHNELDNMDARQELYLNWLQMVEYSSSLGEISAVEMDKFKRDLELRRQKKMLKKRGAVRKLEALENKLLEEAEEVSDDDQVSDEGEGKGPAKRIGRPDNPYEENKIWIKRKKYNFKKRIWVKSPEDSEQYQMDTKASPSKPAERPTAQQAVYSIQQNSSVKHPEQQIRLNTAVRSKKNVNFYQHHRSFHIQEDYINNIEDAQFDQVIDVTEDFIGLYSTSQDRTGIYRLHTESDKLRLQKLLVFSGWVKIMIQQEDRLICDTQVFQVIGDKVTQIFQFDEGDQLTSAYALNSEYLLFGLAQFAGIACFEYDQMSKTYRQRGISCFRSMKNVATSKFSRDIIQKDLVYVHINTQIAKIELKEFFHEDYSRRIFKECRHVFQDFHCILIDFRQLDETYFLILKSDSLLLRNIKTLEHVLTFRPFDHIAKEIVLLPNYISTNPDFLVQKSELSVVQTFVGDKAKEIMRGRVMLKEIGRYKEDGREFVRVLLVDSNKQLIIASISEKNRE